MIKRLITINSITIIELKSNLSCLIEEGEGILKTLDASKKPKNDFDTVEKFLQDILEGKTLNNSIR